jgi:hypothetical protein
LIVNSLLSLVILGAVLVVVELDLIDLRGKADAYEKILNS